VASNQRLGQWIVLQKLAGRYVRHRPLHPDQQVIERSGGHGYSISGAAARLVRSGGLRPLTTPRAIDDIANANVSLFLCSPDSERVVSQCIQVDRGF
jgi:hypothetical protein